MDRIEHLMKYIDELETRERKVKDTLKLWIEEERIREEIAEDNISIIIAHKRKTAFKSVLNLFN